MADESDTPSGELQLEPVSVGSVSRRRALWGVLAVIAVTVASVALFAGGDDEGLPQLPVALGAGGAERAAGLASADAMFAWVTYVAGEGLPALGGEAPAYRVDGSVDESRVQALAGALGLSGDPVHADRYWHVASDGAVLEVYEDGGGTWWYSPTGGVAVAEPGVTSGGAACPPDATECATFSETGAAVAVPEACEPGPNVDCGFGGGTEPCPPEADCVGPPIEPQPPADLPAEAEAREIALDLLAATGMDLGDAEVTVDGPFDAWYVTVEPRLDGVPVAGWVASVGVGSKGAITMASGSLGTPERLGDYPLVDTRAAIDRLNEQMGAFDGGPMPLGVADDVMTSDAGVPNAVAGLAPAQAPMTTVVGEVCVTQPDGTEICESSSGSSGSGTSSGIACPDVPAVAQGEGTESTLVIPECARPGPMPTPAPEPMPVPEPVEVVLTDAEQVVMLLAAFDESGDVYLVPGYRLSNAEGAVVEAIAVADESLVPTTVPETTIPEPTDTTDDQVPPPTACETVVEDDGSGTTHTIQTCPGEPVVLGPGETPEVGVGYYVDVDVACEAFLFGDQVWVLEKGDLSRWSTPHEGGTFTLDSPEHGTFVGDAAAEKTATFVAGPMPDGCQPAPRG